MLIMNILLEIVEHSDRIYWFMAIVGSVVFLVQFAMSLFGAEFGDHMTAGDAGHIDVSDNSDVTSLNFFSLKSIVAFITFFGWAGVIWGDKGWAGLFIALACGFFMMFMTAASVWLLLKLQQSGNITPADLVGQTGTVYLRIPEARANGGKVTVKMPGCTRLVRAVADEALPTGSHVKVIEHIEGDCYLVQKIEVPTQA